jgi:hypothetical protein
LLHRAHLLLLILSHRTTLLTASVRPYSAPP